MKRITKIPIPKIAFFKIPRDVVTQRGGVSYRRWQIQWLPRGYDGETQILSFYFNFFGVRIEIGWRLLMWNSRREADEILNELLSKAKLPDGETTRKVVQFLSEMEKRRWFITLI